LEAGPFKYNLLDVILTNDRNKERMTSDRKAEANRRNALKSTGPKTPEGKAAVRLNALKHGLLSREILLPGEDEEALRELGERLRAELQPAGELENLLVDRITAAYWRLRRLGRVEAGIFAWELYQELAERAEHEARGYESHLTDILDKLGPSFEPPTITDERKHREALERAEEMRVKQNTEAATLGRTFVRDADKANAFSKLSRYETAIERQLYRALHELERRQAARQGGSVPAPVAVDVDVLGIPGSDR
jgi:hypothetical protein